MIVVVAYNLEDAVVKRLEKQDLHGDDVNDIILQKAIEDGSINDSWTINDEDCIPLKKAMLKLLGA